MHLGANEAKWPSAVQEAFEALQIAQDRDGPLAVDQRREMLAKLADVLVRRRNDIVDAIAADFGRRSADETLIAEVFVSVEAARHSHSRVARWARPRRVSPGAPFWPSRVRVIHQPLGVVGVIAPWNYPVQLAIVPTISALAAGNRVLVKPSEFTPRSATLVEEIFEEGCGPSVVRTLLGDAAVAEAVTRLPLDHLLFTGSTETGRKVMAAAAENLVPVTMELGGKCHAIVTADADLDAAARSIVQSKGINAGQTCLAPDTVLLVGVPSKHFTSLLREAAARAFPNGLLTAVVSTQHRERQIAMRRDGAVHDLHEIGGPDQLAVIEPKPGGQVLREEIFGPLLAIVCLPDLEAAIAHLRGQPAPLVLYLYAAKGEAEQRILAATRSGALVVNGSLAFAAIHDLPFGGVGPSGMGRYHGRAGFEAFSNLRGLVRQSRWSLASLLNPPYTSQSRSLANRLMLRHRKTET